MYIDEGTNKPFKNQSKSNQSITSFLSALQANLIQCARVIPIFSSVVSFLHVGM